MGKYLHKFTSTDDFDAAYYGTDYLEPGVSITPLSYKGMLNNSEFTVELIEKNKAVSFEDPTEPNYRFATQDCFIGKDTATNDLYATNALPESGIPVVRVTATPEDNYPYNSGNVSLNGRNTMTTLFLSSSEQIFKVDYNKKSSENVDIVFKYEAEYECLGQEIIYMTQNFGSYELTQNPYYYNVTNSNLTTSPIQSIKVQILHSDGFDGIYDIPLDRNDEYSNYGTTTLTNPNEMYLRARSEYNSETQKGTFSIGLTAGC